MSVIHTTPRAVAGEILQAIRRESWSYITNKPGRVPPADSRNRPELARLWVTANRLASTRRNLRTITYCGHKFGLVYVGATSLYVMDWNTRILLVRAPVSMANLAEIVGLKTIE